jgi:hypothetical protein
MAAGLAAALAAVDAVAAENRSFYALISGDSGDNGPRRAHRTH